MSSSQRIVIFFFFFSLCKWQLRKRGSGYGIYAGYGLREEAAEGAGSPSV